MAYDRVSVYAYPLQTPPDSSMGFELSTAYYPFCVESESSQRSLHYQEGGVLLGKQPPIGSFLPGVTFSTELPTPPSFLHHQQGPASDPTVISHSESNPDDSCHRSVDVIKPDSNTDLKPQGGTKRRKNEKQRVLLVAVTGDGKQKMESPPSDSWAWRKYGQKPIKGSPYPRGYYRCSSSKGCPARKHVERSRSNSAMLIITYTSEHNHPWPVPRNHQRQITTTTTTASNEDEDSISSCATALVEYQDPAHTKLFSITNSCNVVKEEEETQMLVTSTSSSTHTRTPTPTDMQLVDSNFPQDVSHCLSRSSTEEDDFFDDLGELPELSAIFRLCSNQRNLD